MNSDSPLGSFENPIRCHGVAGEREYLARLSGPDGIPIEFNREGSLPGPAGHPYDLYTVTYPGQAAPVQLHFDMYAQGPREKRAPPGLFLIGDFMRRKPWEKVGYLQSVRRRKFGDDAPELPNQYAYIHAKAGELLARGPHIYASQDFFGLPSADWNLSALMACAAQVVHELKGIDPLSPIDVDSLQTAEQFLATFHFQPEQEIPTPERLGTYMLKAVHRIDSKETGLFFRVTT